MSTQHDTDLTVIEHLDFEVNCEDQKCSESAAFLATYHGTSCGCRHEYFLCVRHKDLLVEWSEEKPTLIRCLLCGTRNQDISIDRIEPLR